MLQRRDGYQQKLIGLFFFNKTFLISILFDKKLIVLGKNIK